LIYVVVVLITCLADEVEVKSPRHSHGIDVVGWQLIISLRKSALALFSVGPYTVVIQKELLFSLKVSFSDIQKFFLTGTSPTMRS
jgi:hypothetical protein